MPMSVTAKSAAGLTTTVCVDVQDLSSPGISHGATGRSTTGRTVPSLALEDFGIEPAVPQGAVPPGLVPSVGFESTLDGF